MQTSRNTQSKQQITNDMNTLAELIQNNIRETVNISREVKEVLKPSKV